MNYQIDIPKFYIFIFTIYVCMSLSYFIIKNVFKDRNRSFFAVIGIAVAIATIVALGGIMDGLTVNANNAIHAGGSDITITGSNSNIADSSIFGGTNINESWIGIINNENGVAEAVGAYVSTITTHNQSISLVGINPEDVNFAKIAIIDGKLFADSDAKEVIAGKVLADDENIVVGDDLLIGNETFKVVGIFDSGNVNMDMNYFMSLDNMQNIKNDKGNISFIYVKVDQDFDAKSVEESLESKYGDNMTIVTSISDLASSKDLFDMILGVSYAVSLLAVIIGVVLIINTMLTSVFDRTREIGVLKAIGWSDKRILFMIICESIVLSITAAILGTIIGVVAAEIIALLNVIAGVSVVFTIWTILEAFVIAIIVGAIGGLYPAIKAVKLPPTEALKYE